MTWALALLRSWSAGVTRERAAAAGRWLWARRTPVLAVAACLLSLLYVRSCGRASRAEGELAAAAARETQDAKMRGAGVPVVDQVPQPAVDEEARRMLAEYPQVRAERDRLRKEIGPLRTLLAVRGQTDPVPAHGAARPGEPAPAGPPAPRVLLREGDALRLELAGVGVEGDRGARALLLTIAARRAADGEELARGPLSVDLTRVYVAEPAAGACAATAAERRWRAGLLGGGAAGPGGGGWVAGAGATYRADLWGWGPEGFAGAAAGPGGVIGLLGVLF